MICPTSGDAGIINEAGNRNGSTDKTQTDKEGNSQ